MSEHSIVSHLAERDLGDQLGLDPVRTFSLSARNFDRSFASFERLHPLHQVVDQLGIEAGAHLPCVAQLAALANAEQQRSEAAALVALRPADDDEFLPLDALDLQPVARAAVAVPRAGLLGDEPLAPLLADFTEQLLAATDHMVAKEDWRRNALQ